MVEKQKSISKPWLIIPVLLSAVLFFALIIWKRCALEIRLRGPEEVIIEFGEEFSDPGVQILFLGTFPFPFEYEPDTQLQVENSIDPDHLGTYEMVYQASFLGCSATANRFIHLVDTKPPVIEFIQCQEENGDSVVRAIDNYDGDITNEIVIKREEGFALYCVRDSSGNEATVQLELPKVQQTPNIWLREGNSIQISAGQVYQDPGFVAWDTLDGEITDQVVTEGEVLWYLPGKYEIVYSVTNSASENIQIARTVEVVPKPWVEEVFPQGNIIYLTFDDGPGIYTPLLLDILDRYDVKATFFVANPSQPGILQDIVERGHSIGIHTMTHNFSRIYANPEAYFDDLYRMQETIYQATGVRTTLMRFPGGSSNTVSCFTPGIMTLLTKAVQDAGFQYFDWNVDSNDAGGSDESAEVLENIISGIQNQSVSIVLQHDIHLYSIYAVEELIIWGKENGYTFLPLQQDSPGFHHDVRN